jgi:glycosyltransferase involved in cell wall biosynthesis
MNFSVLLSVYSKEEPNFLQLALKSIWETQVLKPNEIVIVKDGPLTKDLESVLVDFSKIAPIKFVVLASNVGLGLALREGVKQCSFDFIARMDTDDVAHPERFSKQISFLKNNPTVDIISSWVDEFIGSKENVVSTRKVPTDHEGCLKMLKYGCPLNHPSVIFKKKAVINAGNYKSFFLKEDAYLWLRLYAKNYKFANLNESLLYFRVSEEMYRRRGGYQYAKSEVKILFYRYKIGLINFLEFLLYSGLTVPIRLAPSSIRLLIYTKILR